MSKRREPRKEVETSVRIFGTDASGKAFSEKVATVDISRQGVQLSGVQTKLNSDETIGLTYGNNRVHFRVKWVGKPGTPKEGHIGLLNIAPEKALWDFPLPSPAPDNHRPTITENRRNPRFKCRNSVELHTESQASFWATLSDLSIGGCYIEMALPLPKGSRVKVGIWIGDTKVWADCEVAYSTPGLGIGMKFVGISETDRERLIQFLGTLGPFARKR